MLFFPMDISNRSRGAMRCGFLSLSPALGAGTSMRLDLNCDAGHTDGSGVVGVAFCPLHSKPAWNSWSAVRGSAWLAPVTGLIVGGILVSTMAIAGWPFNMVELFPQGVFASVVP